MSPLELWASLAASLAIAICLIIGRAIVQRLAERVADWALPVAQPVSFRIAWLLVLLAGVLAPRRRCRWRAWTSSGPDWQNSPFHWTAPEEARADLDAALASQYRSAAPVRLVLPLLTEALRLRLVNARHRLFHFLIVGPFFLVLLIASVITAPWRSIERLADRVRGRGRERA